MTRLYCAVWVFYKGLEWCERREHIINKAGLKQNHLKDLHVSKEVLGRHNYGEPPPRPFLGNSHAGVPC